MLPAADEGEYYHEFHGDAEGEASTAFTAIPASSFPLLVLDPVIGTVSIASNTSTHLVWLSRSDKLGRNRLMK